MKKQLPITWQGVDDPTGYLFSFAKSLAAVLKHSPYADFAEDIVASSGFAFRMWVAADLCPSATSIWEFAAQKPWVENGGLICDYVQRLWGEDAVEEERREAAVSMIRRAIDNDMGAVAWDISGCEWGVITGYDDDAKTFRTLKIDSTAGSVPYASLGRLDLPILSVLTVTGKSDKSKEQIASDTIRMAASHLRGEEWCDNAKGLAAYPVLIDIVKNQLTEDSWNLAYYLGTYAALKHYAAPFLEKYGYSSLAARYRVIANAWMRAFYENANAGAGNPAARDKIAAALEEAYEAEQAALSEMEELLSKII